MKKLNTYCQIGYFVYLGVNFLFLLIAGIIGLAGSYLLFNFSGIIGAIFSILIFIAYNAFLLWFVYLYCKENKYPGWVWMLICVILPYFVGLIAFIAIIRYPKKAKEFYQYITTPSKEEVPNKPNNKKEEKQEEKK